MVAGPVPLPTPEATAALPEPVSACPQCGFLGIRPATMNEGIYAGGGELLSVEFCPRCEYRGLPARFPRREDYVDYLRSISGDDSG